MARAFLGQRQNQEGKGPFGHVETQKRGEPQIHISRCYTNKLHAYRVENSDPAMKMNFKTKIYSGREGCISWKEAGFCVVNNLIPLKGDLSFAPNR